jgi:tRNA pseudouridine55 synthase
LNTPKKTPREKIDGVILLDKSSGMTSNFALQRVKHLLNAAKAGHTGTLDPLATGLLPICLGEATKFSSDLLEADKTYQAIIKLGQTTTTADAEGEILSQSQVKVRYHEIEKILPNFIGKIQQIPPMYSALKHQGKALYEYARQGEVIPRAPREITIYRLDVDAWNEEAQELSITVTCSKGTYIRVLAQDIGAELECGGHLKALRRSSIAGYGLGQAITLEALSALDLAQRRECLLPVDTLVKAVEKITLKNNELNKILQGQSVTQELQAPPGRVRLYDEAGCFWGLANITAEHQLQPLRLVARNQHQAK